MDPGTFFLLIVVIVLVVGAVILFTGNAAILGRKGSDPERQLSADPDERPRHTRVDLEQNTQDQPHGEPVDRVP
ncbi:MAG: hypothetical protein QOG77_3239 [Solirubrobacteraceae bacterium]|jgi:hypothetical protein|nr:hypothetical protein [Solirubrobacteraceae bacterium]